MQQYYPSIIKDIYKISVLRIKCTTVMFQVTCYIIKMCFKNIEFNASVISLIAKNKESCTLNYF